MNCVFCDIINQKIKSDIIYEDNQIIAFSDINPKAPIHKLIVPRKHIATVNDLEEADTQLVGRMIQTARTLAKELEVDQSGYRLVFNVNRGGGQIIFHIHVHLIGGWHLERTTD